MKWATKSGLGFGHPVLPIQLTGHSQLCWWVQLTFGVLAVDRMLTPYKMGWPIPQLVFIWSESLSGPQLIPTNHPSGIYVSLIWAGPIRCRWTVHMSWVPPWWRAHHGRTGAIKTFRYNQINGRDQPWRKFFVNQRWPVYNGSDRRPNLLRWATRPEWCYKQYKILYRHQESWSPLADASSAK